ncbi:hypothetical protein TrCOL_g7873 [Triparma columacea]|uniref:CMP/dCMP-type deaminase domain-containing protein n=1 Tax=Triparma columacea TaxID=722753 RepID=A0A9W7L8V8_9STRA|nr:hypothetical protein TrCOL_g7873 [Triparma columacea]
MMALLLLYPSTHSLSHPYSSKYRQWFVRLLSEGYKRSDLTGDLPIAASLFLEDAGGKVTGGGNVFVNAVEGKGGSRRNPFKHAEIRCLSNWEEVRSGEEGKTSGKRANTIFGGTTLVSNHEPCTMCFAALVNVGVGRIVFTGRDDLNGAVSLGVGKCKEIGRGEGGEVYYELTEGVGGSTFHFRPEIVYVPFSAVVEWWCAHCEEEGIEWREEWQGWRERRLLRGEEGGREGDTNILKGWWRERRKRK